LVYRQVAMRVGIITHAFQKPTIEDIAESVKASRIRSVQLDLASAGMESLPESLDGGACRRIREAFDSRGIEVAALMTTFNAIHPDRGIRYDHIARAIRMIERCGDLGTPVAALCTGTRDTESMWRTHPANSKPEAWRDLIETLEQLLPAAEACGVKLGIEPEPNNVVDSAGKARRLLDEMRSPNLGIVMDGANLFGFDERRSMRDVLNEGFDLLGARIILAHAKDLSDDPSDPFPAVGTGKLDWDTYFDRLGACGFEGAVIMHNLSESQVPACVTFVQEHIRRSRHE
jgi:sugar phosphate isomerase/epimerase